MRRAQAGTAQAGFSLLEVVLVVAILAVLAALAAPRYGRSVARYRADAAARRIVHDLAFARRAARTAGASRTVTFSLPEQAYTISNVASLDGSKSYRVVLGDRPYHTELLSVDFGGDTEVKFNGYGMADSGGTVRLRVGQTIKTVVFDANRGEASVQ